MENIELTVMIIDDESINIKGFKSKARNKLIRLDHFTNFEDGLIKLKNNFQNYNGVILDARCFSDKDAEEKKLLSDDHIDYVSYQVKRLTEKRGYIPYCIYTGYSGKFRKRLEVQGFEVFAKPQHNNDVLQYIRNQNKAENKYYFEHREVMDLFKGNLLNSKYLKRLSDCFDNIQSVDEKDIKSTASVCRDITEDWLDLLERLQIIPNDVRNWSTNKIAIYLIGKENSPSGKKIKNKYEATDYISRNLASIHALTSHYLHSNNYTNSKYAQKAMIYSLFEILDWFNKRILTQFV